MVSKPQSADLSPSLRTQRGKPSSRRGSVDCGDTAFNCVKPEIVTWMGHGSRPLRECTIFSNNFKLICPVQSSPAKIFRFARDPNHPYNSGHPVPRRGALAIVTKRWGGLRWTRQRQGAKGVRRAAFRERTSRADERRLNAFAIASAGMHLAGRSWWRRKLRTAKPCGPGARGWREAGGGLQSSTGRCEPSIRWRWRQEEFVSRESSA
jgi:hypothetical protein